MKPADDYWFEPKRNGYGAGWPSAWQGWALLVGYLVIVGLSAAFLLRHSIVAYFVITTAATAALLVICARKTRGGWRWRGRIAPGPRSPKQHVTRRQKRRMNDDFQA